MNKHLVNSEQEYVHLFEDFELDDAERFLGVEFARKDGKYDSDIDDDDFSDCEIDRTVYRKVINNGFPKEYPCLVLLENEEDFDRWGKMKFEFLEFVYASDFIKNQ